MTDTDRLITALRQVPEKRFLIAELAPGLMDRRGRVDVVKAIDAQAELNLAIVEVESYVRAVKSAAGNIGRISGEDITGYNAPPDENEEED